MNKAKLEEESFPLTPNQSSINTKSTQKSTDNTFTSSNVIDSFDQDD